VTVQPADPPRRGDVAMPGRALLPGTVNSHCHTFQSLLRGLGDDLDFMSWRDRVLYPCSERLDRAGIALGATFAFAEMLKAGHLSLQPRHDLLKSIVYAMSPAAVTDVWVHGRRVVEDRRLTTISEEELVAGVAALTKEWKV
jgi:cytosine/adenosine deaminase-related metal-dependent hydrolase